MTSPTVNIEYLPGAVTAGPTSAATQTRPLRVQHHWMDGFLFHACLARFFRQFNA